MELRLAEIDEALLGGELGPAAQMAMRLLTRMAGFRGAGCMLDVTRAHVDSTIYVGDAGLEFAERLVELGGRVRVPTTLNVSALDEHHFGEWSVPEAFAQKAARQMNAYRELGTLPTWTCAPYQSAEPPKLGEQIAWGESNAVAFANSVIGARTERYPDFLDVCAALTARVPAVGLHLREHRAAQHVFDLHRLPAALSRRDDLDPVLGHYVGKRVGEAVPALVGLEARPTEDQLKALGAAAASSGGVGLFHVVGVTPEAPTLQEALQGRAPVSHHVVSVEELKTARAELTTSPSGELDLVVLGSPHFSFEELRRLAPLLEGRRRHERVLFLVTTSRATRDLAARAGLLEPLERFGGRVTVDTCVLATPMLPPSVRHLMTSSGKYALYAPGLLRVEVSYGSVEDCVLSAVAGRVTHEPSPWD
jgi:predicted aconitase